MEARYLERYGWWYDGLRDVSSERCVLHAPYNRYRTQTCERFIISTSSVRVRRTHLQPQANC